MKAIETTPTPDIYGNIVLPDAVRNRVPSGKTRRVPFLVEDAKTFERVCPPAPCQPGRWRSPP